MRQTFSGMIGISMCATQCAEGASSTACTTAGTASIVPISPPAAIVRHSYNAWVNSFVAGLVLSTIAYFVASHYIKRYLNDIGVEKSMTRSLVIFVLAAAIAYGVAFIVDWIAGLLG